jgi:hypothetical protein
MGQEVVHSIKIKIGNTLVTLNLIFDNVKNHYTLLSRGDLI